MGLFVPLLGSPGTYVRRPDTDPTEGRTATPATPDELGAGVLVDLDPQFGTTHEARIRGRDCAALTLHTETTRRGYGSTFEAARDRTNHALTRRDRS